MIVLRQTWSTPGALSAPALLGDEALPRLPVAAAESTRAFPNRSAIILYRYDGASQEGITPSSLAVSLRETSVDLLRLLKRRKGYKKPSIAIGKPTLQTRLKTAALLRRIAFSARDRSRTLLAGRFRLPSYKIHRQNPSTHIQNPSRPILHAFLQQPPSALAP